MIRGLKLKIKSFILWGLFNYKKIAKMLMSVFMCFALLLVIGVLKDNYRQRIQIQAKVESLFIAWNNKNIEEIAEISQTAPERFIIETGFENNQDIHNIIEEHIYGNVSYQIQTMTVDNWSSHIPYSKAKITVTTYNNLEILDKIIEQLVNDDTQIDINYNHEEFLTRNIEKIKSAVHTIKRNYQKTFIVEFYYDDKKQQWFIPFDENEEFYNAVSGNMIDFNENVDTNVNI